MTKSQKSGIIMYDGIIDVARFATHEDRLALAKKLHEQFHARHHAYLDPEFEIQINLYGNGGDVLTTYKTIPCDADTLLAMSQSLYALWDPYTVALAKDKAAKTKSSGCFVATACYADPDCREVRVLRAYRDERLARSRWGRLLIKIYYTCSPALANWLKNRAALRSIVRERILNPVVTWLEYERHR